jgi:excisionase family DNA binding protein
MSEQGLTLKDAARRLGVKERTMRKWIADRTVPAVKVGRLWLIREETINQLLERGDHAMTNEEILNAVNETIRSMRGVDGMLCRDVIKRIIKQIIANEKFFQQVTFQAADVFTPRLRGSVLVSCESLQEPVKTETLGRVLSELLADIISSDMGFTVVNGDKVADDDLLSYIDGILVQASQHIVDAGWKGMGNALLKIILQSFPEEELRDKEGLCFLTSNDGKISYLEHRVTYENSDQLFYSGIPIGSVPWFPGESDGRPNKTVVLLCRPKDIIIEISPRISVPLVRSLTKMNISAAIRLTVDLGYRVRCRPEAMVKAINVDL